MNLNDAAARESNRTVASQLAAHLGVEGCGPDHSTSEGDGGCRGLHAIDEKRSTVASDACSGKSGTSNRRPSPDVMEDADVGVSGLRAGASARARSFCRP